MVLASNMAIERDSDGFLLNVDWLCIPLGVIAAWRWGLASQRCIRRFVNQPKWCFIFFEMLI